MNFTLRRTSVSVMHIVRDAPMPIDVKVWCIGLKTKKSLDEYSYYLHLHSWRLRIEFIFMCVSNAIIWCGQPSVKLWLHYVPVINVFLIFSNKKKLLLMHYAWKMVFFSLITTIKQLHTLDHFPMTFRFVYVLIFIWNWIVHFFS